MPRSSTPLLVFLAALAFGACRSDPPSSDGKASGPPPGTNPVDACLQELRAAVAGPSAGRAGKMARGCADLYKEPTCRDAHLHYDDPEVEKRVITLTRACAQVYCPKLPEPRPELCDPTLEKPGDLSEMWWQLRLAIWKVDLGPDEAKRLEREMLHIAAQAQTPARQ